MEVNNRSPTNLLAAAHLLTLLLTEHNEVKKTTVAPGQSLHMFQQPATPGSTMQMQAYAHHTCMVCCLSGTLSPVLIS